MRLIRVRDVAEASRKTANIISAQVILKPDSVLGLATGSSPLGTYRQLIGWHRKGDLDFSQVRTVNLDEYVGLGVEDEQSYARFMRENLFDQINIDPANSHLPDGKNPNAQQECTRYDMLIDDLGGIDLQLLGIGHNGHIGFNEPSGIFVKGTHCVNLTQNTLDANARFFECEDQVPRKAYTMGILDIMQAKRVVMIVTGQSKAQILKEAFWGPVTPKVPASILQIHSDFTLVADEAALSLV